MKSVTLNRFVAKCCKVRKVWPCEFVHICVMIAAGINVLIM